MKKNKIKKKLKKIKKNKTKKNKKPKKQKKKTKKFNFYILKLKILFSKKNMVEYQNLCNQLFFDCFTRLCGFLYRIDFLILPTRMQTRLKTNLGIFHKKQKTKKNTKNLPTNLTALLLPGVLIKESSSPLQVTARGFVCRSGSSRTSPQRR